MNSLLYYYTMQQQQPRCYDGIMQFGTLYDVGVCLRPTMPASGYSNGGAV